MDKAEPRVAFVSYDEKPGIQAISNTAPDLPPVAGEHACIVRDHEYKRLGTWSLLAGIDLLTGQVHACVEDRHRSREFVGFLKKLDASYPSDTAIKIILDNHSAHVSKETNKWLAAQRDGRFSFVFTPKRVLTWQNRITRIHVRERDLFGQWASRWRVIRTSNAYVFRDPQQQPEGVPASKSENPPGTQNQELIGSVLAPACDPDSPLERALQQFSGVIKGRLLMNKDGGMVPAA